MPSLPYAVSGTLYNTDDVTPLANIAVVITEIQNNQTTTVLTNASGQFLFDLANFPNGYSLGDEISLFASYGQYWISLYFTTNSAYSYDTGTTFYLQNLIQSPVLYCSIADVRNFTGIASSEFSDQQVYDMIVRITGWIDEETGRTWRGIQTVTNDLYDGDDTDMLWLNQTDIISITAISIDEDLTGVFTTVVPPATNCHVYPEGYVILDRNANVTSFISGPNNIKVSYTYGNVQPSFAIRHLAILMVANLMHVDSVRTTEIDRIFQRERWLGPRGPQ